MENIKFEITEQDIKEYLKQHKDDENIKYKEAMFVKYMREQDIVTKETLEMMMAKYNFENNRINGLYFYDDYDVMRSLPLRTFDEYLDNITNLDISGICHILIPALGYYDLLGDMVTLYRRFRDIADIMIPSSCGWDQSGVFSATLHDYRVFGKLYSIEPNVEIKMGKEHCRKELQAYAEIYDKENVQKIRRIVRRGY